jgi:hypothetical protein
MEVKAGTEVYITLPTISRKARRNVFSIGKFQTNESSEQTGANTGYMSDSTKWHYTGSYWVQEGVVVRWIPYPCDVAPQVLNTTLIREPQQ